jgi:hypothetical protein
MEVKMAATAVGLFANEGVADAVVDALRAHGVSSKGIRTLAQPMTFPVNSATGTPGSDFTAELARDLRSMGATDDVCDAYIAGVKDGNVLVFATGSLEQADAATAIMNQYTALEIEEYAGTAPSLPGVHYGEVGPHDASSKSERARAKGDGARLFSW